MTSTDVKSKEKKPKEVFNLIYFPVKALAEPIRYILSYGRIKFNDKRINPDLWTSVKEGKAVQILLRVLKNKVPVTPFGQLPVLEVGNKIGYQSIAICRYLANLVDLCGDSPWENLEIDAIVDTIAEFRSRIYAYKKQDIGVGNAKGILMDEIIPFYMNRFNDIAKHGHMALGKLTWADLYFVALMEYCNGILKADILEPYDNLLELRSNVLKIPEINEWIKTRPESDY